MAFKQIKKNATTKTCLRICFIFLIKNPNKKNQLIMIIIYFTFI